jgi:predicted lipid-binding transport protein (Tim44 family)
MIIIIGLIILVAAVVAGVSGVLSNSGGGHAVTHFAMFGYHVTGSTGTLFLYGIVLGAIGLFGLSLLMAGARRTSRRGSDARRGLRQSRRETATASQQRDDVIDQRDTARAETARAQTASAQKDSAPSGNGHASPAGTPAPADDPVAATRP